MIKYKARLTIDSTPTAKTNTSKGFVAFCPANFLLLITFASYQITTIYAPKAVHITAIGIGETDTKRYNSAVHEAPMGIGQV